MSEHEASAAPSGSSTSAAAPPAKPPSGASSPVGKIRWQFVVLVAALLLIVVAVLVMLFNRSASGPDRPVSPVDIPLIDTQIYTEAAAGEPVWVNPLLATSQADRDLASLIYSGLTRIDEFGQPVPDLAESWTVSDDGLTYTFKLRSGVTWHDGAPFTADDVAFTMSLLRDPDFPGPADLGAFWQTIETYAVDDLTVEFVLTQPLAAFPEYAGIGILPAHILAGIDPAALPDDPISLQPVGTGRMWWELLQQEGDTTVVTLRAFDRFYDQSRRVTLDGMVFRFYEDSADAFAALGTQAQGYGGLSEAQLEAALSSTSLNLYTSRLPVYAAVIFNQQNAESLPFFQDENVRQALLVALDRERIIADALGRQALVTNSTMLPGTWAHHPNLPLIGADTARAAQLLDGAGWTLAGRTRAREGRELAFTLLVSDTDADRAIGEAIAEQWGAIGVDVDVQTLDPEDLLQRIQTPSPSDGGRSFEAALVEFSQGGLADPDPYPFWHQSQIADGQNYSGYENRDISEALEIARKDPNGVRRAELYRSYQEWFLETGAAILLYNPVYHYAVSCQVTDVQVLILTDPSDRFRTLHEWRILPPDAAVSACAG